MTDEEIDPANPDAAEETGGARIDGVGPADGFRELRELSMPDIRMRYLAVADGGAIRAMDQHDRHESIVLLRLVNQVPEQVCTHYDMARNLYLYAWHVYRFHVIAEQQALASLEMALRLALAQRGFVAGHGPAIGQSEQSSSGRKRPRPRGLANLMSIAKDAGLITNQGLTRRKDWAQQLAKQRRNIEHFELMERSGLTQMTVSEMPAIPTEEELGVDWLGQFVEGLPRLRNEYAHGSPMLHANVLRTFQIACDLINQLWANAEVSPASS